VKMFDADKTRMIGLPMVKKNYDNTLSRFYPIPIPERYGQTNRQNSYINIVRRKKPRWLTFPDTVYLSSFYDFSEVTVRKFAWTTGRSSAQHPTDNSNRRL